MRDGKGVQNWPDGGRYDGEWKDNKAHGKGKFWYMDGDIYEGEWKDDKVKIFFIFRPTALGYTSP